MFEVNEQKLAIQTGEIKNGWLSEMEIEEIKRNIRLGEYDEYVITDESENTRESGAARDEGDGREGINEDARNANERDWYGMVLKMK